MHEVLVNRLGGLSLLRKSVVRLTDRPDMTLDVYRGRKTTIQQQQQHIRPIVKQNRAKTGVPGERPPDLPVQNLASHMCPERGLNHSGERSNV